MRRADGDGQGVGRVVGLRRLGQIEDLRDHVDDLLLVGLAVARDVLLDLHRRALDEPEAVLGRRQEHDAARLADGDGRRDVAVEEELLDAHDVGLVLLDQRIELVVDLHEAVLHLHLRRGEDGAVRARDQPAAARLDEAEAADGRARVNS